MCLRDYGCCVWILGRGFPFLDSGVRDHCSSGFWHLSGFLFRPIGNSDHRSPIGAAGRVPFSPGVGWILFRFSVILGQPLIGLSKEVKFRGVTPDQGEASNRHRLHVLETPLLVNVQFQVSVGSALWSDRLVF